MSPRVLARPPPALGVPPGPCCPEQGPPQLPGVGPGEPLLCPPACLGLHLQSVKSQHPGHPCDKDPMTEDTQVLCDTQGQLPLPCPLRAELGLQML